MVCVTLSDVCRKLQKQCAQTFSCFGVLARHRLSVAGSLYNSVTLNYCTFSCVQLLETSAMTF